ncbi:Perakine reductase [Camellia lanceoleosa]|uniref:Perakine reductase n=1 Tax=Camellia lanceoleosa TaxID=1840588 RepID=A0ACC0I9C0_9ERIC|nr:Perakine reductase [Camellia lanceoleosa]
MADFEMPRVRLGIHGFEKGRLETDLQLALLWRELPESDQLGWTDWSQNWVMAVWGLVELTILVSDEDGIAIIKYAFSKGITFFDTSDIYGVEHSNEILVGKDLPREKVQLATKFGIVKMEPTQVVVKGIVEYVRSSCEASLKGLGVDYIDLYYVHRIDTSVPIEEIPMWGAMGDVKVVDLGLDFFLGTWNCDSSIFPYCSWFFAGKAVVESVPTDSFLLVVALVCCLNNIVATAAETCTCLDVFRWCQVWDIRVLQVFTDCLWLVEQLRGTSSCDWASQPLIFEI